MIILNRLSGEQNFMRIPNAPTANSERVVMRDRWAHRRELFGKMSLLFPIRRAQNLPAIL
jgi:hypothetical protein